MEWGLLIIRLVVGLTIAAHGAQKLFGWFDGGGINTTSTYFARMGYRPPMPFAMLAGITEFGGGVLLALGLLVPLAAAAIIGAALTALLAVHLKNGFWIYNQGFEYQIILAGTSAGLAFTRAGAWSLDALFGFNSLFGGAIWGVAAVVAGAVVAVVIEVYRRRRLAEDQRVVEVDPPTRRAA